MFLVLRQGVFTVQTTLTESEGKSPVTWAGNLYGENIVYAQRKIQKPGDGHSQTR